MRDLLAGATTVGLPVWRSTRRDRYPKFGIQANGDYQADRFKR